MLGILDESQINKVLKSCIVGRLGYTDGEKIFIVPISYLYYNQKYIIAHSREGQKIEILRKNPEVCLEVDVIHNLSNWESVILWGKYEEITLQPDRYYALNLLIRKINQQKLKQMPVVSANPSEVEDSMVLPDREKAIVYRIKIDKMSGRFERNEG
jgi:nitroimidazol reductase NimA-like FMN-containing flavoprotein (pyridoxamine 5'-phosphate oxidase superfamily)